MTVSSHSVKMFARAIERGKQNALNFDLYRACFISKTLTNNDLPFNWLLYSTQAGFAEQSPI